MNKLGLSKSKGVAAVVAGVSLFAGFFFLDRGVTGNVVLNGNIPPVSALSLVGLFLVLCSGALAFYAMRK